MSQQQMNYEEINRDGPKASYGGYEGSAPAFHDYSTGSFGQGQKLAGSGIGRSVTPTQRLILALFSLAILVLVTFGMLAFAFLAHADVTAAIFLFLLLAMFYGVVVIINVVFNRSH